jgi:hypothetical protein
MVIPPHLLGLPISPANRTYSAIKSALSLFATQSNYAGAVAKNGELNKIATILTNAMAKLPSVSFVSLHQVLESYIEFASKELKHDKAKMISLMTKVAMKLANISTAIINSFP